jgi:hypothetical protein
MLKCILLLQIYRILLHPDEKEFKSTKHHITNIQLINGSKIVFSVMFFDFYDINQNCQRLKLPMNQQKKLASFSKNHQKITPKKEELNLLIQFFCTILLCGGVKSE